MTEDEILDERFAILYCAEYSARYHRRRATFLANLDTVLNLITITAGASAFGDLVAGSPGWLAKLGAALVTLITLLQVILRLGNHAGAHASWLKRWTALLTDIKLNRAPTESDLSFWLKEKSDLETDCVGELRALCYDCENAAARFMGLQGRQVRINGLQRLLIHLGTFQRKFPYEPELAPPKIDPPAASAPS